MNKFYKICFAIGIIFAVNSSNINAEGEVHTGESVCEIQKQSEKLGDTHATNVALKCIVIVNMKQIAERSSIGKIIDQEIAKLNEEAKKRLIVLEKSVKDAENKKESKARIEELRNALYATVQAERERITTIAERIISTFQQEILKEVKRFAQDQYVIVLDSEAVIGAPSAIEDVTQKIVDRLNTQKIEDAIKQILQTSDNNG